MTPEALTETVREASEEAALALIEFGAQDADDRHILICDALDVVAARLRAAETALQQIAEADWPGADLHYGFPAAYSLRAIARAFLEGQD